MQVFDTLYPFDELERLGVNWEIFYPVTSDGVYRQPSYFNPTNISHRPWIVTSYNYPHTPTKTSSGSSPGRGEVRIRVSSFYFLSKVTEVRLGVILFLSLWKSGVRGEKGVSYPRPPRSLTVKGSRGGTRTLKGDIKRP